MPGTLLLDDLRDSVSNQLGDYVNGLSQQATAAVQPIAAAVPTVQTPDPNAILQELQQHAQQAAQAAQEQAQPALQVLGGAQQAAGAAVTQLGQTRDQVAQQLQQHAQDVVSGAQDVQQQLQDHVDTVLGSTTPQVPAGVQSLANPTPPPTLGATDQAANAPPTLGATTGAVSQPAPAGAGPMGPIDSSSPSAFARSIAPYAQYAAQKLGIDPTWVAAMAGSESNYGKAAGNELFGVKALPGQPGTSMQTHEGEYGGTQMNQTFAAYDSPLDAVNAWVDLIQKHYPGAVNAQDLPTFIHGLRQGGYFTAAEDEYLGIVKGISDRIGGDVQAGLQAVGIAPKAPAQVTTAQARAADLGYTDVSQFGDKQLSADEAYAACGPAAAVRFAERFGRNPTLREATDLAKQVGWTSSGGMAGIQSEQKLLSNMGVDTHIVAPDWDAIAKEAQTGNPVTISTPGHYYFADGYNPDTGAFHVGQSGLDLKHGSEWMTPAQMESLMGKAQGALFADNPNVPAKGAAGAPVTLGGGGTQNAPITMGANQPAKAPLVVPEDQGPTPIQSAADVVGGAANDALEQARQALQQAQDALGRATQGAQQTVAPILGGAQQTVSAVAQDVQNAAQGVLGQAQDLNRQIPTGTALVNAAAPVLGGVASDIGTGARQTVEDLGTSGAANALLRQGRTPQEQADFERQQLGAAQTIAQQGQQAAPPLDLSTAAGNVWNLVVNSSPGLPGVSLQDYQHASTVKNQWIQDNNPAYNLPGAKQAAGPNGEPPATTPASLFADLTTQIAQQLTDPYSMVVFGLTGGVGQVPGEVAGARATAATADRLGPQAAKFLGTVADKVTSGAITGAVQNALYVAEQPDATPESVFTALWQGAGFGAVMEPGLAAATTLGKRIGQTIIDQTPRLAPALREFARSETGAVGRPEDVRALAAEQAGRTPEAAPAERSTDNPYDLPRSAPEPNAAPLSSEEVLAHLEQLDQQHTQNQARIADLQNQLAAGTGAPADRAELARLQTDQTQLNAAHDSIWDAAGSGGEVYARLPTEGLSLPGGLDTGAAQAARGPAPENAPPTGGRGEAGPSVPGAPGAPEPTARAEPAPAELGGSTVATPESSGTGGLQPGDTVSVRVPGRLAERAGVVVQVHDLGALVRTEDGETHLIKSADITPTGAAATRALEPTEFRAPEMRPTLEDQLAQARTRGPEGGGPGQPAPPRTIGEVVSNPHLLNEAAPGETPMTLDERSDYGDTLQQRYQANQDRLAAIDERLRNPNQKVERPPWGADWSTDNLITLAKRHGESAYAPLWWERAGLDVGSGEVREDVGQSGLAKGMGRGGSREPSPAELRQERAQLQQDQQHLEAAGEQQATAPDNARFVRPAERAAGALPFSEGGAADPGAQLAQEVVTSKGRIASDANQVVAKQGDITGRGIVNPAEVVTEPPSADTQRLMPNLSAIGKDMPETIAQIQKSAEDNPALWEHYRQGTITFDSLKNDLAQRVGMTKADWLKTKVGQAFNDQEMVALQAAMIEEQARQTDMAKTILAKGGVDNLTPEELAYSITQLTQAQSLAAVAKGAGSTVARSLNARKVSFTRQLASDITAQNERRVALRTKAQAQRVATRAGDLLDNTRTLEQQKAAVAARAQRPSPAGEPGTPKNIFDQIAAAYDELDRYNALSLHEKATVFDKLKAEREAAAAKRASVARGAPEELLSALKKELSWEQGNFAKRKDTWETMAFIDSKAAENAATKRAAFRGGLYIEQQRKSAQLALRAADTEANRAFDAELKRRGQQSARVQKLLESMGGVEVTKDVLKNYLAALSDPDPIVAAKFLQSMGSMSNWKRATVVRLAGLVSSPITQMVNIGGNAAGAVIEVPTRALVVGIDALRARATGGERQAYAGEILPMLKAYGPGFLGQWDNAVRVMKTGITPEQLADPTKIRGAFSGSEKLNLAVEAPLRLLGAADQLFRGGAMAAHSTRVATRQAIREGFEGSAINGRAATIVKNLEDYPELAKEAADATARQVYQERRAGFGGGNKPLPDVVEFGVKQALPFYQTPMNITAQGAAMSPLGFTGALQSAAKARGMAVGTAAERSVQGRETLLAEERAARALIGSAILGGGMALGSAGMLTGSYPIDPKEASTLPQGWRPWSVRVTNPVDGNTYYVPMQNFNAAGFPLAMAAILTDPAHRGKTLADPDEQLNAATAIGRYVLDNTFLQGLSDVVNTLHDPKSAAQKFGEGLAASYGPYSSLGREFQRIAGVATRNPHNGFVGLAESLEANYPGFSGNVPEATTPLGEPRTQAATGIARVVPYRYDIERDTPLLQQLRESGVGIPTEHKSLNYGGQHIDLNEDEQDVLKRQRGETIKQYLDPYVNDPKFQNLSQADRNRYLTVLMSHAVQYADHQFLNNMSGVELTSRLKPKTVPDPYYLGDAGAAA